MSEHNTYLTDEELEQLIADVEANEMITAPPGMMEEILAGIQHKKKIFQLYCFRVITSAAAAILLLFPLPQPCSFL